MSEGADYERSSSWVPNHDFREERRKYEERAVRVRIEEERKPAVSKTHSVWVPSISTTSSRPLIVISDVTGSMGRWPAVMAGKLPYLYHEARDMYLGEDVEICWMAVGDAYAPDNYPLQIRPFAGNREIVASRLKELFIEGGGGSDVTESYELAALYLLHNCTTPNTGDSKPVVIFIADEQPYDFIPVDKAKNVAGVTLQKRTSTKEVFAKLQERFAIYLVRKPYGDNLGRKNEMDEVNRVIYQAWVKLLGFDHIASLPDAERIVDVIFGILAAEVDKEEEFRGEIERRQRPEQVTSVYKALETIHRRLKPDEETRQAKPLL
ncbi:MAG: hypothetical protein HZA35_00905 [Parcubacteria group bacterium]|nr:hypothetical protein [Parcubacteria group bacterium]